MCLLCLSDIIKRLTMMFTANSKRQIKLRISQNIKRAAKNSLKQNNCIEKTNMELLTLGKEK